MLEITTYWCFSYPYNSLLSTQMCLLLQLINSWLFVLGSGTGARALNELPKCYDTYLNFNIVIKLHLLTSLTSHPMLNFQVCVWLNIIKTISRNLKMKQHEDKTILMKNFAALSCYLHCIIGWIWKCCSDIIMQNVTQALCNHAPRRTYSDCNCVNCVKRICKKSVLLTFDCRVIAFQWANFIIYNS